MLKIKMILCLFSMISLSSCVQNKVELANEEYFFSLKNYFEEEAQRLTNEQTIVLKEVKRNSSAEKKDVKILDWKKEFGLFIESDINKLSWKDSYHEILHHDTLIYRGRDPKLRTQEIIIIKENKQIKKIVIKNVVENYLYNSIENLIYYPDSLYQIDKKQDVIVIGTNAYQISGYFR